MTLALAWLWWAGFSVAFVVAVVLAIAAIVSIVRTPGLTRAERTAWLLLVIIFPLLGPIGYFVIRRGR